MNDRLALVDRIVSCTACELHAQCRAPVPFRGSPGHIAIVGEAPGEMEDKEGRPFIGPAGKLLKEMLTSVGLTEPMGVLNTASCLSGKTKVFLSDGSTERIEKLVRSRYRGEVLCADERGDLVARRVTGWHRNSLGGRRLYRVTHEYSRSNMYGPVGFVATGDHEVLTERGWVSVEDLKPEDRMHTGMYGLGAEALQIVLSGILGDAALDRRTRTQIEFQSSEDERGYISAKRQILFNALHGTTARGRGWPRVGDVVPARASRGWTFRVTHPEISTYSRMTYPEVVRRLDDFGLALWFMDDGHLRLRTGRQPDAQISVARMSIFDAEAIASELKKKGFQVEARISSMGPRLMFGVEGTKVLLRRLRRYMHPDHRRKAGEGWGTSHSWARGAPTPLWGQVHLSELEPVNTVYCLSVEEHQNFVTVGGVVHNCFPHGAPKPEHIAACDALKWAQIDYLDPTYLLVLGRVALKAMRSDLDLRHGRGRPFLVRGRVCFCTYHPAAALRNGRFDTAARWDLKLFADMVGSGDWKTAIPDTCAGCPADATWYESSGLGWCEVHLPASEADAYQARFRQLKDELNAARTALRGV